MKRVLAINPGGVSTKVALFDDRAMLWGEDIQHTSEDLKGFPGTLDQLPYRLKLVRDKMGERGVSAGDLAAVVGRGGLLRPLDAGAYRVNDAMLDDIREGRTQADHPSNLGALLAHALSSETGIPAFIVDPVCVDQFDEVSRFTGLPEMRRLSLLHALNVRATAFKAAQQIGRPMADLDLVVAHLGSGYSICPMRKGRIVDVNNANDGGPFSPMRAGNLPVTQLVKLAYSGRFPDAKSLNSYITKKAGLTAHLGTHDLREVERRVDGGDSYAGQVLQAMVQQVCKEVGAMAAVLDGKVDAVVVTGGVAYSKRVSEALSRRLAWIAPVMVFPGENELESLALGALRVLEGEEEALEY